MSLRIENISGLERSFISDEPAVAYLEKVEIVGNILKLLPLQCNATQRMNDSLHEGFRTSVPPPTGNVIRGRLVCQSEWSTSLQEWECSRMLCPSILHGKFCYTPLFLIILSQVLGTN